MAEKNELGLDNLKSVNWLNDAAPAPPGLDTSVEETSEPVEQEEPAAVAATPEDPVENDSTEEQGQTYIEDNAETTAEQKEPAEQQQPEEPVEAEKGIIETLTERLGYEVEGSFADDYDGLEKYTSAVASKIAEEQLGSIFNEYPDVKEYFEYRANNGDPLKYFKAQQAELDYTRVAVDDNVAIQKRIVQDGMQLQGFDEESIVKMTESYEDAGILKDNAEVYLKQLQRTQALNKQHLLEQQEAEATQQRSQAKAYWEQVATTVNTGSLKGLQIPTRQRKQFYDWMTSPIKGSNQTQRDLDRANLDTESALALEYLIYQGFDLSKLSQNVANTKKTQSLKSKLQSAPSASTRMKSRSKSSVSKGVTLPSLRDLL